jgi:GNAT superfamily N-acetyltransferase
LALEFATSFTPHRDAFDDAYASLLAEEHALLVVAENDSAGVVGYLLAHLHQTFLGNGPVVWVEEVMVDAGMRRDGVGTLLMAAAEDWAVRNAAAYVSLASRRATEFYAALGYDNSAIFFKKTLA